MWHLIQGAYAGVEGHLPQSLEGWRATGMDKPGWDPALWLLLDDAKGIVGAALGENGRGGPQALGDRHLARGRPPRPRPGPRAHAAAAAVRRVPRRRLRFAEAAVHGSTAAAARVFESAGMTPVREAERWEKVIGV